MRGPRRGSVVLAVVLIGLSAISAQPEVALAQVGLLRVLDWEQQADRTIPGAAPPGWNKQYCCSKSAQLVSSPTRNGQYAARFQLNRGDPDVSSSKRAELSKVGLEPATVERWYGFSIFLPSSWARDPSAEIVTQWHHAGSTGSPPLSLNTRDGRWEISQHWEGHSNNIALPGMYETERWTDWVFHIKWSAGSDGLVQIWKDGQPVSGFENRTGKNKYNDGQGVYMKFGIYKWDWKSNPNRSITNERVLFYDELRIADERASHQIVAPGGSSCLTGTAGQPWPSVPFPAQTGRFTATAEVTPLGAAVDAGVGLGPAPASSWTDMAAIVRFDDTGLVDARDGNRYTADTSIRYKANTTYRVRFVLDVPAHRYSAYLTPPGGAEVTIGSNLAFRVEQQAAASLTAMTVATAIGSLRACDFTPGTSPPSTVIAAAGDIAGSGTGDEATAKLLDSIAPAAVLTTGDNAYPNGTASEYASYYHPTWGRHRAKTHPTAGNHDYRTANAAGYFGYFNDAAGESSKGYYSYDLGSWHLIALNSEVAHDAASAQVTWLKSDLAASSAKCTLAYWHRPRFSGGTYADNSAIKSFWDALYAANSDVVLAGHDHNYQRFVPLDPAGSRDVTRGIREFVVGTGGRGHYALRRNADGSLADTRLAAANDSSYGVLKLTLHAHGYDWQFVPESGSTFTDSGSASCH
jgi:hypothetical protein